MKKLPYREVYLLMNQEILAAIDSAFMKLATIASLVKVLKGKDALPEEERFSDEVCELQSEIQESYQPLVKSFTYQSKALTDFCSNCLVIPTGLIEDLNLLLEFKEEESHISDSPFSPYTSDLESFNYAVSEYYLRIVSVYRVKAWLDDISNGLQEYGVDPYLLPDEEDPESINLLDGVNLLDDDALLKELNQYLLINEDIDTEDDIEDKTGIKSLNLIISDLTKEK